jgi:hypothetical protein
MQSIIFGNWNMGLSDVEASKVHAGELLDKHIDFAVYQFDLQLDIIKLK